MGRKVRARISCEQNCVVCGVAYKLMLRAKWGKGVGGQEWQLLGSQAVEGALVEYRAWAVAL